MKILVTGSKGFLGKNLVCALNNGGYSDVLEYDKDNDIDQLCEYTKHCDFVFHLAGVNRPKDTNEFQEGNVDLTKTLLKLLEANNNKSPILITSSIQAELNNYYGNSKRSAEDLVFKYAKETGANAFVYRLPNVFGKWCRPNYNSVVATFCSNIANDLPITVNDRNTKLKLVYIDDVVNELISCLNKKSPIPFSTLNIPIYYNKTLGEIVDLLYSFKESRKNFTLPNFLDPFEKKLYSTYLSYLSEEDFSYPLKMNIDNRGSFTEFIRTEGSGQVSINISKPGITKGNHYHHTKNEKFLVVSGEGVIKFRKIGTDNVIEYKVSSNKLEVIDIPPGYTHSISNTGCNDLVTVMWANELFDKDNPDTYFLDV